MYKLHVSDRPCGLEATNVPDPLGRGTTAINAWFIVVLQGTKRMDVNLRLNISSRLDKCPGIDLLF